MQPIDPKLQSAVWGRVMAGCPAAGGGMQPAGRETIPAEEVLQMMQMEKNDCAVYRYLACRACGSEARTLRQMADDKACHVQKLHAMYFLETGKCVCLQPEKPDCTACLTEALRGRYETARKTADLYEKAAERWPDMSDEFLCMAADETRHSKCIRSMICRRL